MIPKDLINSLEISLQAAAEQNGVEYQINEETTPGIFRPLVKKWNSWRVSIAQEKQAKAVSDIFDQLNSQIDGLKGEKQLADRLTDLQDILRKKQGFFLTTARNIIAGESTHLSDTFSEIMKSSSTPVIDRSPLTPTQTENLARGLQMVQASEERGAASSVALMRAATQELEQLHERLEEVLEQVHEGEREIPGLDYKGLIDLENRLPVIYLEYENLMNSLPQKEIDKLLATASTKTYDVEEAEARTQLQQKLKEAHASKPKLKEMEKRIKQKIKENRIKLNKDLEGAAAADREQCVTTVRLNISQDALDQVASKEKDIELWQKENDLKRLDNELKGLNRVKHPQVWLRTYKAKEKVNKEIEELKANQPAGVKLLPLTDLVQEKKDFFQQYVNGLVATKVALYSDLCAKRKEIISRQPNEQINPIAAPELPTAEDIRTAIKRSLVSAISDRREIEMSDGFMEELLNNSDFNTSLADVNRTYRIA